MVNGKSDFVAQNHGSVWVIVPRTEDARRHLDALLPEDAQRWGRDGVVVAHRLVSSFVANLREDGFTTLADYSYCPR